MQVICVAGMEPRRFETLAELMLAGGFSESRVDKVLGGNLVRVFGDCW